MTEQSSDADAGSATRDPSLVLAGLHLRLGSLGLARAELETLAGRDALDDAGLVDLLEARWRTGDLAGAGAVASLLLGEEGEEGPLLALVVASEAAGARGRPTEARRFATAAMAAAGDTIDAIFAGMPRGPAWPSDAMTLDTPAPTLFDQPAQRVAASRVAARGATRPTPAAPDEVAGPEFPGEPATLALWSAQELPGSGPAADATAAAALPPTVDEPEPELPAADDAFEAGRAALAAGALAEAAKQLALALRLAPTLAPDVLDAIDARPDRELAFVRGDAYRLLGREREARRAFADALRPAPSEAATPADPDPQTDPTPTQPPPEGDPA